MQPAEEGLAFPGAEGFGKYTRGGRGGKVMVVKNLNDDGPGSFRQAATAKGPRIIVFAVSGIIHLETPLGIRGDVTIAGQTAPGDGICLADQPVKLDGDNVIVRYLRFRMGDRFQSQKGKVHGSGSDDAFSANRKKNIIIDHCSMSWSTDEVFSVYGGDSTTLQWNLISEPLNYSYHFETGDTDFEHHGYGGIWGGQHLSAHHNLIAHCSSRNPRFNGARLGAEEELVHFTNNVIYNWGHNSTYGGEGGRYNMVNNFYKYGPSTSPGVRSRIVNPSLDKEGRTGKFYVQGNVVDGNATVSRNNWEGIELDKKAPPEIKRNAVVDQPFPVVALEVQTAEQAYEAVLKGVGASLRRDTLDQRICNDVRNRTGRIIDVQGGFPHATPYEQTVNAWPALASAEAPADGDNDGMPDSWEKQNGLNPASPSDAGAFTISRHYSNIEVYINSLINQKR
jgi:pectate lyase